LGQACFLDVEPLHDDIRFPLSILLSVNMTHVAILAAVAVSGVAAEPLFDVDLASLTKPPLWEPTVEEYFPAQRGGERDEFGLPSPVVLTNPTREEFVYHARKGYPILVSDWSKGMTYTGWTGKHFAEEFPFGYMKAEYIDHMPGFKKKDHDIKIIDGEKRFNLGTFKPDKKKMWYNFSRPANNRYADDPLKPQRGPYVWHVKDELTPPQKKKVQARFEAPAFLADPLNKAHMNRTFEIWFSPGGHTGAGAHNDGYCESVVSLQLTGDKNWRKMLLPEMTFLDSFDEFDGGVYEAGRWKPDLGFVNKVEGALVWPPGYLHETSTVPPADGSCGAAITLQYAFPQPVQFLRAFLPRLSLSAEVGQCGDMRWSGYVTMYVPGVKPSPKEAKMKEQLATILKMVDTDKDDKISVSEVLVWFKTRNSLVVHQSQEFPPDQRELFYQFKAADTVAYHDMDDDMIVSRQELWDSLVQWNVVRIRVREGLKHVNKADRAGLEAFERSLDNLRRSPATLPKGLRPELQEIFSLGKGTRLFKSLKHVRSLSDSEFFSPAREIVEQLQHGQGGGRYEL